MILPTWKCSSSHRWISFMIYSYKGPDIFQLMFFFTNHGSHNMFTSTVSPPGSGKAGWNSYDPGGMPHLGPMIPGFHGKILLCFFEVFWCFLVSIVVQQSIDYGLWGELAGDILDFTNWTNGTSSWQRRAWCCDNWWLSLCKSRVSVRSYGLASGKR